MQSSHICANNRDFMNILGPAHQVHHVCHRRCSESLDYSDCCIKSSMIEMRMIERCLRGQVARSNGRELSLQQEVEDKKASRLLERQEDKRLYLPLQGK
jgi:hypothetical protein